MPVKRTAWACAYRCGRNVLTSHASMARHERTCFHNPAMRACQTCAKYSSVVDSNGMEHDPECLHTWRAVECADGIQISGESGIGLQNKCASWFPKARKEQT